MKLYFTKEQHKPSIFKCIRSSGTETWTRITQPFMLEHDLLHYAVETTLGFRHAFYGLLSQGYNITDFEAPRHRRPEALLPDNLPLEAQQAEMLVGLFQTQMHDEAGMENFIDIAKTTFDTQGVVFPAITSKQVQHIRTAIRMLLHRWNQLPFGEVLSLTFSLSDDKQVPDADWSRS